MGPTTQDTPSIRLRTQIPGPRSQELMKRRDAAIPRAVFHYVPVFTASAKGALLEDVDGNIFIDLAGGIGCLNAGHCPDAVVEGVRRQSGRFLHSAVSVSPYEGYVRLAERLNELTPGSFLKKTLIVNTGAEAVENAIKLARAYTKRAAVICFEDAFHGRTLMTLSLTGKARPYKAGFGPFVSDIYRIPFAYCYRCAYHLEYPSCQLACARRLKDLLATEVAPDSVAAVIAEPVLGEGGFIAPPPGFFQELLEICRENGILFIADEIQTGIGRTGALFACERYGIEPDLIVTSKSIGGGLPIAAVTGRAEIMDTPDLGGLGGTYNGNPVACEAALAVLDIVEKEDLSARAQELGDYFEERAQVWRRRWPLIGNIHGLGGMRAIELVLNPETREPATAVTAAIIRDCYENGVIILSAGRYGNIIRLLMPLVITGPQFEEALLVLERAIGTAAEGAQYAAQQTVTTTVS